VHTWYCRRRLAPFPGCRYSFVGLLGDVKSIALEGAYLIVGLLVALQTQFEFERDKNGRWSVKIKKKATSDALLKPLVKKLITLLGLGD
jgi:hypothetical protein